MQQSFPKGTNCPPSPPLVQCCWSLTAQACISCVTANNIAIREGGNNLWICDGKHFVRVSAKNRYFCNMSRISNIIIGRGFERKLIFEICARNFHFHHQKQKKTSTSIHLHLFSRTSKKFSRTKTKFKGFQVLENKNYIKDFQGVGVLNYEYSC